MLKGLLFLLVALPLFCMAQSTLRGKVSDVETGKPVTGASVFLTNTSVGTTTDAQGNFELVIPAGRYELIISYVGYETKNLPVSGAESPGILTVQLNVKAKELETVVIEPYEKNGWEKWGRFFTDNFIGQSSFAKSCTIRNQKAIKFRYSKKRKELEAIATEPLVIENKALGYSITYQLEQFHYDFNRNYLFYQGYPLFRPLKGNKARQRRWEKAREDAFYGSMLHFMRTVYRNTIHPEGFEVYRLQKIQNSEKARVQEVFAAKLADLRASGKVPGNSFILQEAFSKDSSDYYKTVLRQPDTYDVAGKNLLTGDSIAFAMDSVTAGLEFNHYLLVIYKNKKADPVYSRLNPRNGTSIMSQVTLINKQPVAIQANGNFYDSADLLSYGYWAWSEKISTMLPFDYLPPGK
jgi:hypothetical protein